MGEKEGVTILTEIHLPALTDHAGSKNHTIDWANTLPVKKGDWTKRGISWRPFPAGRWGCVSGGTTNF